MLLGVASLARSMLLGRFPIASRAAMLACCPRCVLAPSSVLCMYRSHATSSACNLAPLPMQRHSSMYPAASPSASIPSRGWQVHCTSSSESGTPPQPHQPAHQLATAKTWSVRPITKDDVEFSFSRASGAGGQNVNKVSTKVDMRLNLDKATWIPYEIRAQMITAEKNRITNDGYLVCASQKHRTQAKNLDDALEKMQSFIDAAVEALTPTIASEATVKRVKAQIKAGKEKRLDGKKMASKKKADRRNKNWD